MSLATRKYENILIIGNLNIDTSNKIKYNANNLYGLCDTCSLKDLIADTTCVKYTNGTFIDVLLTNKSRCFHHFQDVLNRVKSQTNTYIFKAYFKNFLRKILNIGIIKTLTKIISFKNLISNSAKDLSIRNSIINMMPLQIFLE